MNLIFERANREIQVGGDFICLPFEGRAGIANIEMMLSIYKSIFHKFYSDEPKFKEFTDKFQAPVNAIDERRKEIDGWVPFSTRDCERRHLGEQAYELTKAMTAWAGIEIPKEMIPETNVIPWTPIIIILSIIAGIIILPPIFRMIKGGV